MKRSNQKRVVHHVIFWFGLFSEAGRFVHTTHKTLLNMWVPLGVFCMCHFLDLSTYFLVQAKDEIWNLMRRPLGRVPPFQCSIVSHASLQLKWMPLNFCCGETYRQFPYRYYLTDSSYLLERCKMMRTCVWPVYFPDPWLHFGGMCRKLNPLEQSERFSWCKCLSSHSRHQPCSLFVASLSCLWWMSSKMKISLEVKLDLNHYSPACWCFRFCFMFPSNHILFVCVTLRRKDRRRLRIKD